MAGLKLYPEPAIVNVLGKMAHHELRGDGVHWYQSQLALLPKPWRDNFGGPTPLNMWALAMVQDDPITRAALRGAYELIQPETFEVYALTFQKDRDTTLVFRIDEATGLIGSMALCDDLSKPIYSVNSLDTARMFGVADSITALRLARAGELRGRDPFDVERIVVAQ